jgi:hypothetical protein
VIEIHDARLLPSCPRSHSSTPAAPPLPMFNAPLPAVPATISVPAPGNIQHAIREQIQRPGTEAADFEKEPASTPSPHP